MSSTPDKVIAIPDARAAAEALSGAMNQLSRWVAAGHSPEAAWDTLALLLMALRVKQ
jgi:hypothetical protein